MAYSLFVSDVSWRMGELRASSGLFDLRLERN